MKSESYRLQVEEEGSGSSYIVNHHSDFEHVNPIDWFRQIRSMNLIACERYILKHYGEDPDDPKIHRLIKRRAEKQWRIDFEKQIRENVPEGMMEILEADSKKDQVKALKGVSITSSQFISFILKAYAQYGFLLSHFKITHHHNGLDTSDLPEMIHVDEEKVKTLGATSLTKGQLRNVVEHRKVIVAKFLEKGDEWHCFFLTYKGLAGKESHVGGAHIHYISDKWGMSRDEILRRLRKKKYSLPSTPHIGLEKNK